ncbi:MAG: YdcF family protein [Flavobacteriales bacterium]
MFFLLSKILSVLTMPMIWVFMLLIASIIWKRFARRLRIAAITVLLVFSSPLILGWFMAAWEVPIITDEELDDYAVGVVLGGFSSFDTTSNRLTFRLGADRFNQALRLLEMKKIKKLVVSGGSGYVSAPEMREALFLEEYLEQINIPDRKFLIESNSRNTHENAVFTADLLKDEHLDRKPILLITSGFHMRRAIACFEKAGLKVVPYTTDPMNTSMPFTPDMLLPDGFVLGFWNVLFHEWIGYASYWMMGYV